MLVMLIFCLTLQLFLHLKHKKVKHLVFMVESEEQGMMVKGGCADL